MSHGRPSPLKLIALPQGCPGLPHSDTTAVGSVRTSTLESNALALNLSGYIPNVRQKTHQMLGSHFPNVWTKSVYHSGLEP